MCILPETTHFLPQQLFNDRQPTGPRDFTNPVKTVATPEAWRREITVLGVPNAINWWITIVCWFNFPLFWWFNHVQSLDVWWFTGIFSAVAMKKITMFCRCWSSIHSYVQLPEGRSRLEVARTGSVWKMRNPKKAIHWWCSSCSLLNGYLGGILVYPMFRHTRLKHPTFFLV